MAIYQKKVYQPYFYIIQDIRNGIYYAGAKWAKGCHPDNFMVEGGYTTSSKIIKEIIRKHGLNCFIVCKIKTFDNFNDAYNYETRFLQKIDAKNNLNFYNGHNNDSNFNHEKLRFTMMELYGVEHYSQTNEYNEKYKATCLEKYGVENYTKTDDYNEKYKATCLEKYGVENYTKTDDYNKKTKITCLEKYGVDHHTKTNEYNEKYKATCLERYGVEYYSQTEVRRKELSDNNPAKDGETLSKIRNTKANTFIEGKNLDTISAERAAKTMKKEYVNEDGETTTIYKENGKKISEALKNSDLVKIRAEKRRENYYSSPECPWVVVKNVFDEEYNKKMPLNEARKISPALDRKTKDDYLGKSKYGTSILTKKDKKHLIGLYCEKIE